MNTIVIQHFNREVVLADTELKQLLNRKFPITGYEAIEEWNTILHRIRTRLTKLLKFALEMGIYEDVASVLYELEHRFKYLPVVPPLTSLTKAQNMLRLRPYVLAIEDTQYGEQSQPELKRITVMTSDEHILFDRHFVSQHKRSILSMPSSSAEQQELGLSWKGVWAELTEAVSGHYVLAYDLELAQVQLEVTAERFHLSVPVLLGESFLNLYAAYTGSDNMAIESEDFSQFILAILAQHEELRPQANFFTAPEQARRLLHMTEEMAKGTLIIPSSH